MPPGKRSGRGGARKTSTAKEPAAIKRLNKALKSAEDALAALRKDNITKEVSARARALHKDLEKVVRDARRNTGKLSQAIQRDVERLQKQLAATTKEKGSTAKRKSPSRSGSKRTSRHTSTRRVPRGGLPGDSDEKY